jgi:hypothetical protein
MSRNKGDKDYTKNEKEMLISMINDYQMFRFTDLEMMDLLSKKLGKNVGNTTFYRLKKEANKRKINIGQWLDNFVRFGLLDFFKERLEEMTMVQNTLVKQYLKESHKKEDEEKDGKQNKQLMNQLAKTITDNSKIMSEIAVGPATIAKLLSLIPQKLLEGDLGCVEKYFNSLDENKKILWSIKSNANNGIEDDALETKIDPSKAPTAILPPIDNLSDGKTMKRSDDAEDEIEDEQRIF